MRRGEVHALAQIVLIREAQARIDERRLHDALKRVGAAGRRQADRRDEAESRLREWTDCQNGLLLNLVDSALRSRAVVVADGRLAQADQEVERLLSERDGLETAWRFAQARLKVAGELHETRRRTLTRQLDERRAAEVSDQFARRSS